MTKGLIYTDERMCSGCNKCILKCPVGANHAVWDGGKNVIKVDEALCVNCAECLVVCDHEVRLYRDDTARFFDDLEAGVEISVIAAPAARTNFPKLGRLFGFLKSRGVRLIYDVSYGADICTWAYIKTIQQQGITTMIAQPCPVIVDYIERFRPNLIPQLAPVQSPAMCTAIYLNKYRDVRDKIAFLSPCIGKKSEFISPDTHNSISYNVTYKGLVEHLEGVGVNLEDFPELGFDNLDGSWGFTFSRPGGLRENVELYLGQSVWVKQIEGVENVGVYLDEYADDLANGHPLPLLVDVLNCTHGCNLGTGTLKNIPQNNIDHNINSSKSRVSKQEGRAVFESFDRALNPQDFVRNYTDRSDEVASNNMGDVMSVYRDLGKLTEEDKNVNCFSCGYGSCEEFAKAVAAGKNHLRNCTRYAKVEISKRLESFDRSFLDFTGQLGEMQRLIVQGSRATKQLSELSLQTKNISLKAEQSAEGERGFTDLATEIKCLADNSSEFLAQNSLNAEELSQQIRKMEAELINIQRELHRVMTVR